jgi:hypothetical protein
MEREFNGWFNSLSISSDKYARTIIRISGIFKCAVLKTFVNWRYGMHIYLQRVMNACTN